MKQRERDESQVPVSLNMRLGNGNNNELTHMRIGRLVDDKKKRQAHLTNNKRNQNPEVFINLRIDAYSL